MKMTAELVVDQKSLDAVEDGSFESAFAWLEDSGLYLKNYDVTKEEDDDAR